MCTWVRVELHRTIHTLFNLRLCMHMHVNIGLGRPIWQGIQWVSKQILLFAVNAYCDILSWFICMYKCGMVVGFAYIHTHTWTISYVLAVEFVWLVNTDGCMCVYERVQQKFHRKEPCELWMFDALSLVLTSSLKLFICVSPCGYQCMRLAYKYMLHS